MTERLSDELLNAYVDGELDGEDRERIEQAMEQDEALRERVDELVGLKRLVASAYADAVPGDSGLPHRSGWKPVNLAVAASIAAFVLGVTLTWGLLSFTGGTEGISGQQRLAGNGGEQALQVGQPVKVMFHLSRGSPERLQEILNEAEALLTVSSRTDQPVSVRIIASGSGLSLFERGAAIHSIERVREMKRMYAEQLILNGCGVAYKQLKQSRADGDFELIPEMQLVDLGVLELMRRQRDGWAYIRL